MIQQAPQADPSNQQLQTLLQQATKQYPAITVAKSANIYTIGDHDTHVYFIESGQIKLVMLSNRLQVVTFSQMVDFVACSGHAKETELHTHRGRAGGGTPCYHQ